MDLISSVATRSGQPDLAQSHPAPATLLHSRRVTDCYVPALRLRPHHRKRPPARSGRPRHMEISTGREGSVRPVAEAAGSA